tara:strand:- start:3999 stop:5111 length:1113 start_codon:yes stop_codon:yes gene_type:complete
MASFNSWKNTNNCYYKLQKSYKNKNCLAFDFDDTLVKKNTCAPLPNVIETLKTLIENKYNIIVFSNQKGIEKKKTSHEKVQEKMENFSKLLDNSITFFYATSDDEYRKPCIGMFELFKSLTKSKIEYYCGDAAGRPKDFSISDLYFANNINVQFKLPEEIFNKVGDVGLIATTQKKSLTNSLYANDVWENGFLKNKRNIVPLSENIDLDDVLEQNQKYLILLVGPQGSGKTTIRNNIVKKHDFEVINNDTKYLQQKATRQQKFDEVEKDSSKKGIIVDNTNPSKAARKSWMDLAPNWKVIIIFIDVPRDVSFHSNKYRVNHKYSVNIPKIAINIYYKKLQIPTKDECYVLKTINKIVHNGEQYNHNLRFV